MLLAEDRKLCSHLKAQGIVTQTLDNSGTRTRSDTVPDVTVLPAKLLGEAYQYLGKCVHVQYACGTCAIFMHVLSVFVVIL